MTADQGADFADRKTLMTADESTLMTLISGNQRLGQRHQRHGQTALEYAIFIAVVAAALITMNDYVRRSIQANLKVLEDNINAEAGAPVSVTPPVP